MRDAYILLRNGILKASLKCLDTGTDSEEESETQVGALKQDGDLRRKTADEKVVSSAGEEMVSLQC
jgi:hypothetical protein